MQQVIDDADLLRGKSARRAQTCSQPWLAHIQLLCYSCRSGTMMMRQLHFAMLDLELHARYQPGGSESVFDVDHRIAQQTMVMKPLQEDRYMNAALDIGMLFLIACTTA